MTFVNRFMRDPVGLFSLGILVIVMGLGILAPWISPHDPLEMNVMNKYTGISKEYLLGTDQLGRCVFSRLLYGIRTTFFYAVITTLITISVSTVVGVMAGFFRGKIDAFLMRICDFMLSFPSEVMILAIVGVLGPGILNIVIANIFAKWAWYTRMIRSLVIGYADKPYIQFAKVSGAGPWYIMRKHVAKGISGELAVFATLDTGWVILNISALSFLGLGVGAPVPEWGMMLSEAKNVMITYPAQMLAPGIAIVIVVAALNFLGDSLNTCLHPKTDKYPVKGKRGRVHVFTRSKKLMRS